MCGFLNCELRVASYELRITCPVGAHYVHGKVERKIRDIKKCLQKTMDESRFSVLQWETLGQQISNSINSTPICLGNKVNMLEP